MALPTSYLTSVKNVDAILNAIQAGQAPTTFTVKFLETLGFTSSADRLFIKMLKVLGFLDDGGVPRERYYEYLDQTQAERVMAAAMREAYADLFQIKKDAQTLSAAELRNKMKTLTQGQASDAVLQKMISTFQAFAKQADFSNPGPVQPASEPPEPEHATEPDRQTHRTRSRTIDGLVYNINIELPQTRDKAVYDALFRSLKEHLL
jgi:hypothetical protein